MQLRNDKTALASLARPFSVNRIRARFDNEQGEGVGVARGFIVTLCDAVLQCTELPPPPGELVPCR